ncbi:hypothetical protein P4O66_016311 [Electrophorus voltai]|uniref:CCHC-type domain-containing protein n=1 Tax=Electrophorus voltai TaxID=2609070 RepID=A0AAD9DPD3_9TELE|nr:hypothetical protein P4O66_016311 [Electrophorus voltai]
MAAGPAEVSAWEAHLRNSFMNGLRDQIRKERKNKRGKRMRHIKQPLQCIKLPQDREAEAVVEDEAVEEEEEDEQDDGKRDDRCYTCGKKGHFARDWKQDTEVVAKALLTEIIPRWGIPNRISSDNGTPFVNQALDMLSKYYHPTSGGAVERENGTLKSKLAKTCQETGLAWTKALPLVLMSMRMVPKAKHGLSLYEILFGHPPNAGFGGMGAINQLEGAISDIMLSYCMTACISFSGLAPGEGESSRRSRWTTP